MEGFELSTTHKLSPEYLHVALIVNNLEKSLDLPQTTEGYYGNAEIRLIRQGKYLLRELKLTKVDELLKTQQNSLSIYNFYIPMSQAFNNK